MYVAGLEMYIAGRAIYIAGLAIQKYKLRNNYKPS